MPRSACVCGTGCNLVGKHGSSWRAGTQGSHQAELAVAGTCPGKRPDVTQIKTTHTPCQTAGRMDGWREDGGAIKKYGKENNECQSLMDKDRDEKIRQKREGNGTKADRKRWRKKNKKRKSQVCNLCFTGNNMSWFCRIRQRFWHFNVL